MLFCQSDLDLLALGYIDNDPDQTGGVSGGILVDCLVKQSIVVGAIGVSQCIFKNLERIVFLPKKLFIRLPRIFAISGDAISSIVEPIISAESRP